jgi:hypothetical protein
MSCWRRRSSDGQTGARSDPAAVFLDADTLVVAAQAGDDGAIMFRARKFGRWGAWTSLGQPQVGATSAPALVEAGGRLIAVVLGADGLLYQRSCADPGDGGIADADNPDPWIAFPAPPASWWLVGRPAAVMTRDPDHQRLVVGGVGSDRAVHLAVQEGSEWSGWAEGILPELAPDDPAPGIAIVTKGPFGGLGVFARNKEGMLANVVFSESDVTYVLGGILASAPGAVATGRGDHMDVVALISDHGRPGVWWKFNGGYRPICTYNAPNACSSCGCNVTGSFLCDR